MLMLKCREVVAETDALVAGELPRLQYWKVTIHLLGCRYCRRYVRQLRWLLRAFRHHHGPASAAEVAAVMGALPPPAATAPPVDNTPPH